MRRLATILLILVVVKVYGQEDTCFSKPIRFKYVLGDSVVNVSGSSLRFFEFDLYSKAEWNHGKGSRTGSPSINIIYDSLLGNCLISSKIIDYKYLDMTTFDAITDFDICPIPSEKLCSVSKLEFGYKLLDDGKGSVKRYKGKRIAYWELKPTKKGNYPIRRIRPPIIIKFLKLDGCLVTTMPIHPNYYYYGFGTGDEYTRVFYKYASILMKSKDRFRNPK